MRILFCGETFPGAQALLQLRLPSEEFCVWRNRNIPPQCAGVDILIPMMFCIDAAAIDAVRPRLIHQWGSGLEGVDLNAARERGVAVACVPATGSNAESVAEHILLLILALLRHFPDAHTNVRCGLLGAPLGRMLAGRTVCLWGLGATALSLSRRLRAFGVRLLGITRSPCPEKLRAFALDACYAVNESAECLRQTHILVLCVRLSDATRGLINASVLATLPQGACLVNAARGALVDYSALYDALASGHLAGAALDVFWQEPISSADPLLSLPNLIATPHIAGVTEESYREIADVVVGNIERLRGGQPLLHREA